jgi:hypothetical protein
MQVIENVKLKGVMKVKIQFYMDLRRDQLSVLGFREVS